MVSCPKIDLSIWSELRKKREQELKRKKGGKEQRAARWRPIVLPSHPSHLCPGSMSRLSLPTGLCPPSLDLSGFQVPCTNPIRPSRDTLCPQNWPYVPFSNLVTFHMLLTRQWHSIGIPFSPLTDAPRLFSMPKHCSHRPFALSPPGKLHSEIQESNIIPQTALFDPIIITWSLEL